MSQAKAAGSAPLIGVLALQGAFIEHEKILASLGARCTELRKLADWERCRSRLDGLVLPGGESTAQGKLLRELGLLEPMRLAIAGGLPTLGTCAGMILLAEKLANDSSVYFGTMPITVRRNAYGRQLGSFRAAADFVGIGRIPMTFIRAPYIESAGKDAEILAVVDERIVAARWQKQLALAFHPELDGDTRLHEYFLQMCRK